MFWCRVYVIFRFAFFFVVVFLCFVFLVFCLFQAVDHCTASGKIIEKTIDESESEDENMVKTGKDKKKMASKEQFEMSFIDYSQSNKVRTAKDFSVSYAAGALYFLQQSGNMSKSSKA